MSNNKLSPYRYLSFFLYFMNDRLHQIKSALTKQLIIGILVFPMLALAVVGSMFLAQDDKKRLKMVQDELFNAQKYEINELRSRVRKQNFAALRLSKAIRQQNHVLKENKLPFHDMPYRVIGHLSRLPLDMSVEVRSGNLVRYMFNHNPNNHLAIRDSSIFRVGLSIRGVSYFTQIPIRTISNNVDGKEHSLTLDGLSLYTGLSDIFSSDSKESSMSLSEKYDIAISKDIHFNLYKEPTIEISLDHYFNQLPDIRTSLGLFRHQESRSNIEEDSVNLDAKNSTRDIVFDKARNFCEQAGLLNVGKDLDDDVISPITPESKNQIFDTEEPIVEEYQEARNANEPDSEVSLVSTHTSAKKIFSVFSSSLYLRSDLLDWLILKIRL